MPTERIFPYQTLLGELDLSLGELLLDGRPVPASAIHAESRSVQLVDLGNERVVKMSLSLHAPPTEIESLDDRGDIPKAVVVAECPETDYRVSRLLERSRLDPAVWYGDLEISGSSCRGKVVLTVFLVGTVENVPMRYLAESPAWSIHFDESSIPLIEGTLRVQWRNFSSEELPLLRKNASEIFVADLAENPPVVFLNKDFEGLPGILSDNRNPSLTHLILRETEYLNIARSIWMSMAAVSIAGIRRNEDGEEPDWPLIDWQKEVLQIVLALLYPDFDDRAALNEVQAQWESPEGVADVTTRLQTVVGRHLKEALRIRRLVKRAGEDLDETEESATA